MLLHVSSFSRNEVSQSYSSSSLHEHPGMFSGNENSFLRWYRQQCCVLAWCIMTGVCATHSQWLHVLALKILIPEWIFIKLIYFLFPKIVLPVISSFPRIFKRWICFRETDIILRRNTFNMSTNLLIGVHRISSPAFIVRELLAVFWKKTREYFYLRKLKKLID